MKTFFGIIFNNLRIAFTNTFFPSTKHIIKTVNTSNRQTQQNLLRYLMKAIT